MKFYIFASILLFFQSSDGFYDKFFRLGKTGKMKTAENQDYKEMVVVFESNNRALNKEIYDLLSNPRIILKDYIKIYYLKIVKEVYLQSLCSKVRKAITENKNNNLSVKKEICQFIIKTIFDEIFNLFQEDLNDISVKYREECEKIIFELKEFLTLKFKRKISENDTPPLVKKNFREEISIDCNELKLQLSVYFKTFILNYLRHLFTYFGNFKIFAQEVILKNHRISYYYETIEYKKLDYIFKSLKYETLDIYTLSINFLFNCNDKNRLEDIINIANSELSNHSNNLMIEKGHVDYILFCLTDKIMNSTIEFSENFRNMKEKFLTLDKKTFPLTKETIKVYKQLEIVLILNLESFFLDFFEKIYEIIYSKRSKEIFQFKKPFQSLQNAKLSEFHCFERQEKKLIFKILDKTMLKRIKKVYFNGVNTLITVFIDKSDTFLSEYSKNFQIGNRESYSLESRKNIIDFLLSEKFFKDEFFLLTKEYLNISNKSNITIHEL